MLLKNDELKKAVEKTKNENKDSLWEEERACFKAGFYTGLATAGAVFTAALGLAWKLCKK